MKARSIGTSFELARHQAAEVAWYRRHGKHVAERITHDRSGCEYVIGDWSWRNSPRRKAMGDPWPEEIENRMLGSLATPPAATKDATP